MSSLRLNDPRFILRSSPTTENGSPLRRAKKRAKRIESRDNQYHKRLVYDMASTYNKMPLTKLVFYDSLLSRVIPRLKVDILMPARSEKR